VGGAGECGISRASIVACAKGRSTGRRSATGKACPEGWKLHTIPGPQFRGVAMKSGSAESPYYDWVDQFDTLGLGKNTPIATGNLSDAMFAFANGKFVTMRVPYPMGFFSKGMDGRIDDPNGGWKGGEFSRPMRQLERAHRRRQGSDAESGALPNPPRPVGEVMHPSP
jgi:hypothetical protein